MTRPMLAVDEVLLDPLFTDGFTVTRRPQVLGTNGRVTTPAAVTTNQIGVVTMAGPDDLERLPDNQRMGRVISVVSQFRLQGPGVDASGNQYQPDVVTWRGDQYVVTQLDPYPAFGAGWTQALCASIDSIDLVPSGM